MGPLEKNEHPQSKPSSKSFARQTSDRRESRLGNRKGRAIVPINIVDKKTRTKSRMTRNNHEIREGNAARTARPLTPRYASQASTD